jgi:predicted DNA-binding antitoxin AbrB/MazE fold protein
MEFRGQFEGVYEDGVIRPSQPLDLPEHTRVRGTIETPSRSQAKAGDPFVEFRKARADGAVRLGGQRFTRDELHDRG